MREAGVALGVWLAMAVGAATAQPLQLNANASQPRAFGYQVGDRVSRSITVDVPDGLLLDEASVPKPGARGSAIELRSVARSNSAQAGGRRLAFTLDYQVFLSPREPRTLEMPGFTLRFRGQPRDQEVLVEAWPVTVAPLVPEDVSYRRGLGELQPDAPPPLLDTRPGQWRLAGYGVLALLLLAYLAQVYIGIPWWARTHRPFAQAWRALRGLGSGSPDEQWREAFKRLHDALNKTQGEVLFEPGIEGFVAARPRFAHLRGDLVNFFEQSRHAFFGGAPPSEAQRRWLIEFCRRCRDAERTG